MKQTFAVLFIAVFLSAGFSGCDANSKTKSGSSSFGEDTFDKDASYALGMNLGASLKDGNIYPDLDEFILGMKDALTGEETRFDMNTAGVIFQQALSAQMEKRNADNMEAENKFLAENSTKPGINITDSGLQYEVITEGSGPKPTATDLVRVHYEGALTNGTVFDSSYARGEPVEFHLDGVIPGWTEGLQLMSVGSKYRLIIPSNIGYGSQGMQNIPPYSTLVFEVELLEILDDDHDHAHH